MEVRINENSYLNQVDDDLFEANKPTDLQGRQVQNIEHLSCNIVQGTQKEEVPRLHQKEKKKLVIQTMNQMRRKRSFHDPLME